MIECKEFYLNNDDSWTIVYKNGINSVVETLPIDFDYIGNTVTHDSLSGVTYRYFPILSCQWDFTRDGKLCPILKNEKWGFVNSLFEIVIEPQFDYVGEDIEGEQLSCWRPPLSIHKTQWLNGNCCVVLNGKTTVVDEKDFISSEKCVIEQNTNYAYKLKHMDNPTFDEVRDLSTKFYRELPQALQNELFEALNRGIDILDSEPQMTAYLFAYGKMHKAKLNYAFEHLPGTFFEIPEINIIDYGCGQAVATMCYADFLRRQGYKQKIRRVTLIEPSEAALKRAALHVSVFFPDAEIVTINKKFDDLETKDIVCDEDVPTLHLLSNVLDLECFSLITFKKLVKKRIGPSNLFVCVGPYFGDKDRGKHMDSFAKYFKGEEIFSEDLDAYELDANNSWTCMVRCFKVGDWEENLSTEVTHEDVENGIEDEYGMLYSRDGKRLLRYHNDELKEYNVKDGTKIICDYAFADGGDFASFLKKIFLPDSVTHIGKFAFSCFTLQSLNIPQNVTFIGGGFIQAEAVNREQPTLICNSPSYKVCGDNLYTQNGETLHSYFGNSSTIIVNEEVKNIGEYAFYSCNSVHSIIIPDSLLSIGDGAFQYCTSLKSVNIPSKISKIGDDLFYYCRSLRQITIPDSVTTIGKRAFYDCSSLRTLIIPASVKNIGDEAFYGCSSLQTIIILGDLRTIGKDLFGKRTKLPVELFGHSMCQYLVIF